MASTSQGTPIGFARRDHRMHHDLSGQVRWIWSAPVNHKPKSYVWLTKP